MPHPASRPARRAYYREALRLTRRPRWRRYVRYHLTGPVTVRTGCGVELSAGNCTVTIGPVPPGAQLPARLPVLTPVGPVTETWAAG